MASPLQHQIIARALEIIADEARWTTLVVARTADGEVCSYLNPLATRFCAMGAIYRATSELLGGYLLGPDTERFVLAANGRPLDSLSRINDQEGHKVIVAMFRQALAS